MTDSSSGKAIFIADDDSDDRFFIKNAITSSDIKAEVIEAEDGLALIALLKSTAQEASLIIVDMNMPKMNGMETISHVRQIPGIQEVPVVIISTSPGEHLADKASRAGVAAVYKKPNSLEEFDRLVQQLQAKFLL
ncbi:response regulator [Dyadobacter sandarakinus]|uniref:Response regulator n=1 Tax=Dyadobacter sandarakinus TaxID=2747268 RepID=A0ABX7I2S5_9BACT|nr:response regulator [Dyadobacter sandarakinus]QRR00245.1 response regulator [Dyadobacter sandarakinus]